ncbi:Arfgef1 [Symbiodinium natans]|uniref:Arfgef1 protein n=1 Tax=Symbiodinium natans TaxID=878477 RepID=A0A812GPW1_9DINO|nr:Arfgef1 [Symbiodinium natans]
MGNHALCGEKGKCGGQCSQLTISQSLESIIEEPEPSGAVFPDTLEGLNAVDRNLLQFCASSNLAGVRWLLVLGGNRRATDQKGTTCLHAACRSGSCSIVEVLVFLEEEGTAPTSMYASNSEMAVKSEAEPTTQTVGAFGGSRGLQATDEAGWTPLHVAAFMGRQDVVRVLLRNGANTLVRTNKGQFAVDLCSDVATRRLLQKEMKATPDTGTCVDFPEDRVRGQGGQGNEATLQALQVEGTFLSRSCVASPSREIRFEPFFVPRAPLLVEDDVDLELAELCAYLGCQIFESSPGRGLAFLVVTGSVRDYPIDLVGFMRTTKLSPLQVGTFLGEDFSLSKILRMEFLNSVCLTNTGVVSALRTGLTGLKVPPDLQKMNRLLSSLSEVWWRQQLRAAKLSGKKKEKANSPSKSQDDLIQESIDMAMDVESDELRGTNLKSILPSISSLHQLFFSTVMLHWNLHAPLPPSQKLDFDAWAALNRGGTKEDVPDWVLEPIYRAVATAALEELSLEDRETQPAVSSGQFDMRELAIASATGWVQVFADGLPTLPGAPHFRPVSFVECMQIAGMICESTASARMQSGRLEHSVDGSPVAKAQGILDAHPGSVWLSLCGPMLFFEMDSGPGLNPFAFLHTKYAKLAAVDPPRLTFTLCDHSLGSGEEPSSSPNSGLLQLVVLLQDGRFQAFHVKKLVMRVSDASALKVWVEAIASANDMCREISEDARHAQGPKFASVLLRLSGLRARSGGPRSDNRAGTARSSERRRDRTAVLMPKWMSLS